MFRHHDNWPDDRRPQPDQGGYPGQEQYPGRGPYPGQSGYPGDGGYPGRGGYDGQGAYQRTEEYPGGRAYPGEGPYGDAYRGQSRYPEPVHVPDQPAPPEPPGPPRPQRRPGGGRPAEDRSRSRPSGPGIPVGFGALAGLAGLTCVLLALMVLPWFTAGGQDVHLSDLRAAFEDGEGLTEPESGVSGDGPERSLPDDLTSPGQVTDAVEDGVRDAAGDAADAAVDTGKARYLELYTERLWVVVAAGAALAVVFSTILAPRSFALSLLLGFRRLSGVVTVLAGSAHGAALWFLFTGDGAPEPAYGVWLGLAGFAAVLGGCVIGPKRT